VDALVLVFADHGVTGECMRVSNNGIQRVLRS
jgi:hypothetical protein